MRHRLPHPAHATHRTGLRALGLLLTLVGGVFTAIGLVSFFAAFGGAGSPTLFWCVFVGLPLFGIGIGCLKAGYLGPLARYVASETAPVAADTIDYLAKETQGAVRTTAAAIAQGLQAPAAPRVCPSCRAPQRADASFCDRCGVAMPKAASTCTKCAAPLREQARFCHACGTPAGG